jgi:hypothetical protein
MQISLFSKLRYESFRIGWTKEGDNIKYFENEENNV